MANMLRIIAAKLLRSLIQPIGLVIMSQRAANALTVQRDCAVVALAEIENASLKQGLVGIVVSKDRALQLYSLLCSYRELVSNQVELTVIYSASTVAHAEAYKDVETFFAGSHPKIAFVKEVDSFRITVNQVLSSIQAKNIFFLVDDIMFIRPVDLALAAELDVSRYVLSLRHSPSLTRSYTANVNQKPPTFSEFPKAPDIFQFEWFKEGNEWSDPWSLDGQILSTAEIRVMTRVSDFLGPNTYEGALKTFNSLCLGRQGLCYSESKILNLPINRVQNEVQNLSGEVSPEFLLNKWNEGMMLDSTLLHSHIPRSPHEEHPAIFKRRPACVMQQSSMPQAESDGVI